MMEYSLVPIIAPLALILGGVIAPFLHKERRAMLAVVSSFFALAIVANSWVLINIGEGALFYPTEGGLLMNASSAFVVELTLILGFLGAIYSFEYFEDRRHLGLFYSLYSLFLASLVVMAISFNVLVIYAGFEASTIAGGILILFTRRKSATKAAVRFFIMSVIGAIAILGGILYQNYLTGGFILTSSAFTGIANSDLVLLATIYAIGFSIKVGIFPFGLIWLPPAHSEAPTPVSAILSGVMVQIAAFAVARIIGVIAPVSPQLALLLIGLGGLSLIIGAAMAVIEATAGSRLSRFHVGEINIRGIKRIWAFSTSSEVGVFYMLIGLAILTPSLLPIFFIGVLLHFLNHGLAKALLFFDSGFVIERSRVADLSVLKGLGRSIGPTGVTYLIGGFSLSLIPGTLGYTTFREFTSPNVSIGITALVFSAAAMILFTTVYSMRCFVSGKPAAEVTYIKSHEAKHSLLRVPGIVIAVGILALGIVITLGANQIAFHGQFQQIEEWVEMAAKTIANMTAVGVYH
uniref:NADH:quinone oxidoreductase/Mrp antiporter transmembrane domain-containing protein n=1 Tax=Candidatus Methanomethylicus mesodigestus TaxID=1867258 RepID=A0A7C3FAJ0_9CREN